VRDPSRSLEMSGQPTTVTSSVIGGVTFCVIALSQIFLRSVGSKWNRYAAMMSAKLLSVTEVQCMLARRFPRATTGHVSSTPVDTAVEGKTAIEAPEFLK